MAPKSKKPKKEMHLIHKVMFAVFIPIIIICTGLSIWIMGQYKQLEDQQDSAAYFMTSFENEIMESGQLGSTTQTGANRPRYSRNRNQYGRKTLAGNYLIARFAQSHHDWEEANDAMGLILQKTPEDLRYLKRAMILAMGSGDYEASMEMAKNIQDKEGDSALTLLFLISEAIHKEDYALAKTHVENLPQGSVSDFILPMLKGWINAANGEFNIDGMTHNSVHLYHAILIADFMGRQDDIHILLENAKPDDHAGIIGMERIADIYAHIGRHDKALELYRNALEHQISEAIEEKILELESGDYESSFEAIKTPQQGIAEAFYDMARALIDEYSDESARVFGRMALYLDPEFVNAKLLLAHITSRNERISEAIGYYESISSEHPAYLDAQRKAAALLEETEQYDASIEKLTKLVDEHDDISAQIQIGDLHRRKEEFKDAIINYNTAADMLDTPIDEEYWHLHYVRGMSYERDGQWERAEKDLQAALSFQPNHPYVLNYLGYAWADQGVNLDESLEMIERALTYRPSDGYITDSLGWVLYRVERYEEAALYLERAVELLPYDPTVNDHLGDAYWKIGRKLEAKFQWERALNHAEDQPPGSLNESFITDVQAKLQHGLETALDTAASDR